MDTVIASSTPFPVYKMRVWLLATFLLALALAAAPVECAFADNEIDAGEEKADAVATEVLAAETIPQEARPVVPSADTAGWLKGDDGSWYYFVAAGAVPSKGWMRLDGSWYYLDPADNGKMRTGLFSDGRANYICSSSGALRSNQWVKLGGDWYYAGASGALETGWLKSNRKWYYLLPGERGRMVASEARTISGVSYAFDSSGAMATGWVATRQGWYYAGRSGSLSTGWIKDKGIWYYLQPDKQGLMATGWQRVNGAWYYLRPSGAMAIGWAHDGTAWYYLQPSGAMATGWLKDRGTWYYLAGSGAMAANQVVNVGGASYYLTSSGAMATGWAKTGDGWYYADHSSGAFKTGWLNDRGTWYYLQPDKHGLMVASETKSVGGALYSFASSGAMRANAVVDLGGGKVGYASASGAISQVGAREGGRVVLRSASGAPLTGWQKIGGAWFYGDVGGVAHTGWLDYGGSRYWMDADGVMATGARTIDGKNCVFSESGALVPVSASHWPTYQRALLELTRCTNSAMTKEGKLWAAYKHIRDDFREYQPRIPHTHANGWENLYADDIFIGRGGNCFSCASSLAFMAKAIGYDNVYVCNSGTHGWAEIDGLIYDPEQDRWHDDVYYARPYSMPGAKNYASAISAGYSWMRVAI